MKIRDALAHAAEKNESAFNGIAEARATKIVALTLKEVLDEINTLEEGKVPVPGFGTFVVKQVERTKDGEKVSQKRVVFLPRSPERA